MVFTLSSKVRRGRDRNVGEFTTTYAISPYHHEMCEFEYQNTIFCCDADHQIRL